MNDKELQQLLADTAEKFGVVGAQLAIYDGENQREFVTGHRNRELGLFVTPHTLFQIGSTTKVFNAALVLSLVDAGKVDLDTPVQEYIRYFHLADDEAQARITLRHLLSMSSGLDNGPYYDFGRGDDALGRYVECLGAMPQIFAPGSAYGYSNASTNVTGHAAASVMGQPWEQLLTERIWEPLGLKDSALFAEDLLLHPVALGYNVVSGSEPQRTPVWCLPRSIAPAGGLTCCSAGNLVGLGRMFLDRGKSAEGARVLSESAIDTMQHPQITLPTRLFADEWCAGPYRKKWGGYVLYGHSGTNVSGSSMLLWCPEKNIAIATVVNVANQGYPLANAIFDEVFPKVFGITKPAAASPESVIAVKMDLTPYVGRFEAFGTTEMFTVNGDDLKMRSFKSDIDEDDATESDLIPLGEGRFLPCDLKVSGNRNWDFAFWGSDAAGRATHLLRGAFASRRTG